MDPIQIEYVALQLSWAAWKPFKIIRFHLSVTSFPIKKLLWFIDSVSTYNLFMNLETYLVHRIYKAPSSFLESLSTSKIPGLLTLSFLTYCYFKDSAIFLAKSIFDLAQLKIINCLPSFYISVQKITLIDPIIL